jgi:glutamate-ammonia-ligase adenylyltransferase
VAVSLETFRRYQAGEAWTWERLALTRARVIAGPLELSETVSEAIRTALSSSPARSDVAKDARHMRDRLAAQFPGRNRWDLKFAPGGLVDIEFIAQALQLLRAPSNPDVLHTNTIAALTSLAQAGALPRDDARTLIEAARLQQGLTQVLRIAIDGPLDPDTATPGLRALLARGGRAGDFTLLETELAHAQRAVRAIFQKVLPAG